MALDLKRDGYYVITPEHTSFSQVPFTEATIMPETSVLQKIVGGYIEIVYGAEEGMKWMKGGPFGSHLEPQGASCICWCNEDGLSLNLPVNILATRWTREHTALAPNNVIVGNFIIVCGEAQKEPPEGEEEDDD